FALAQALEWRGLSAYRATRGSVQVGQRSSRPRIPGAPGFQSSQQRHAANRSRNAAVHRRRLVWRRACALPPGPMTSRWSVPWRHRTVVAVVAGCYRVVGAGVMLRTNQALEASQITRHPQPERALLEPGGLLLVEWLRLDGGNLMAAANASMWLAVAGALLLL